MSAAVQELKPQAGAGLTMEIVRVTPAMAEKWLAKNVHNRGMRPRHVARLTRMMLDGQWRVTGEAIKFAYDGTLIDGQHRLAAVFESQKTIPLLVIKGLHPEVQDVLDTGAHRSAGDQLHIHGHANPSLLAAAARVAILWEQGRFYTQNQDVSHASIIEYVDGNHTLAFSVARARAVAKGADLRASVGGAALYLLLQIDDQKAIEFFDRLTDGTNLSATSPILALRSRLRTVHDERTHLPHEALLGLVFRSWNAWVSGRTLTTLPLYKGGELIACPDPVKPRRAS